MRAAYCYRRSTVKRNILDLIERHDLLDNARAEIDAAVPKETRHDAVRICPLG
jgi:hypothetical protein